MFFLESTNKEDNYRNNQSKLKRSILLGKKKDPRLRYIPTTYELSDLINIF